MSKYSLLRERVHLRGWPDVSLISPPAVADIDLLRVHDPHYLRRVTSGRLSEREIRRIGFPWSVELVQRSRRSSGATLAACSAALQDGIAVSLAGGTHHAFADRGEGFCVFNDSVIAARALQAAGDVCRVLIVDCDVHQGNGTAAILRDDPSVYTFSIHGARNYPFHKEKSDLDIPLDDGAGDAAYLSQLTGGLERALQESLPDLVIYIAGADPFEGDRLGRLAVSRQGLLLRDQFVMDRCRQEDLPVAVTMGGGYAPNPSDIVDIHENTVAAAYLSSQRLNGVR